MKVLILAGGRGTRLWPASRSYKPKQFQSFFGKETMLQTTFERVAPLVEPEDVFVATNEYYFQEIKKELPQVLEKNIILEPAFRERVAAFLLFFCYLSPKELKEPVVILPSDHLIKNEEKFRKAIQAGMGLIKKIPKQILLFGEKPRFPDIGLGYIKKGKLSKELDGFKFFKVEQFKEKPNLKRAKEFLKEKNYFWNAGIFIFIPELVIKLAKEFVPDNYEKYKVLRKHIGQKGFAKVLQKEYSQMDKASFDYSILENYNNNVVLPISMGWSDVGSWSVLKDNLSPKNKNYIKGNYLGVDSKNIMVYGTSPQLVAACGVKDLIIVATDDVIFVCKKEKAQDVKKLIDKIEKNGKREYL
jgi:mannose-1-phosphate guanylyltransferase